MTSKTISPSFIARRVNIGEIKNARSDLRALAALYLLYDSRHSRRYPVYIGQTADAYRRLRQHRRHRRGWDFAVVVAPAPARRQFTLTDIHYLEAALLALARRRRRLRRRLQNQVMPAMVYAPPDTRQRLERLIEALASLLASGPPGHSPQAPPGHPPDKPKTRGPGRRSHATCQPSSRGHPPEPPLSHPPEPPLSHHPREAASPLAMQKPP